MEQQCGNSLGKENPVGQPPLYSSQSEHPAAVTYPGGALHARQRRPRYRNLTFATRLVALPLRASGLSPSQMNGKIFTRRWTSSLDTPRSRTCIGKRRMQHACLFELVKRNNRASSHSQNGQSTSIALYKKKKRNVREANRSPSCDREGMELWKDQPCPPAQAPNHSRCPLPPASSLLASHAAGAGSPSPHTASLAYGQRCGLAKPAPQPRPPSPMARYNCCTGIHTSPT